jgi:hypothetical protein
MVTETANRTIDDTQATMSWKAVLAGATGSLALTLVLLAFGIGFSVISP